MAIFPKMQGGDFPHIDNVNVNQWTNDFDYSRYDSLQMKLTICAVPWDMGEAHIGNRTISGIGNVVWFETKAKRDKWFAAIPDNQCYRFETKYKDLPHDGYIDVPLPFDIASRFNYIMQEFEPFANEDSYVKYEAANGHRKWFWFIREVEYLAPNTTRLHILDDAFQTWMYDVNITGMILERGHAPMFETFAADYLTNPIAKCGDLLAEDVNYGEPSIARHSSELIFNAKNMHALFITTSAPTGTWGTKSNGDWKTPGMWNFQLQSVPTYFAFVVPVANFSTFMNNCKSDYPQFFQTVKAIAFVSSDLLDMEHAVEFTFASVKCYGISSYYKQSDVLTLDVSEFGYPARYSNIAKLYTYPYSYILMTDENGAQTEIRIEDTNGKIQLEHTVNLIFPWLSIQGNITGVGKTARKSITFANLYNRTMPIQGNWFDLLYEWKIPTFGIYLDGLSTNDYATYYDRVQQQYAIDNQYDNVAETADCLVDNADLTAATNTAATTRSNTSVNQESSITQGYNTAVAGADNTMTGLSADSTIAANEKQGAIAAASGAASSAAGAIGSLASGNIAGAVGAIANAVIGGSSTLASTAVANSLTATQAGYAQASNSGHATLSNDRTLYQAQNTTDTQTDIAAIQNDLTTGSAANTAAMQLANGARDKDTGEEGIANQINQAAMNAPSEFGAWNAGQNAVTRPMGLFANIVTQNDYAISCAGDEMLRYGYMYGKQWDFNGNWNVGKHFTYWKLRDFWVKSLNVPDMYMDRLRFFLFGGVTVWRKPEDIGNYSIYENGV